MDRNMRRLPPWMLAGTSSATSNPKDNKNVEVKSKHEPGAPKTKAEKRPRRTVKPKERNDSEKPKKSRIKRSRKIEEEEAKPSIEDNENPEITQSMADPDEDEEDLTVDDLLSFAQEYVKGKEESKERESLSISESMVVGDKSKMSSSQGGVTEEPNGARDPTTVDMLDLLLGPFFKTSQH